MTAPACTNCEGRGWYEYEGRTSAPVASPPMHRSVCGECEGDGIDHAKTCENCGEAPREVDDQCKPCAVEDLEQRGYALATAVAMVDQAERLAVMAECPTCVQYKGKMHPSHFGSSRCESGSLASGGPHSHCTCDTCF